MSIFGDKYEMTEVRPGVFHHVITNYIDKTPAQIAALADARHFSLTTTCLNCKAVIHGDWVGDSPYTLACAACGASHTVEFHEASE